MTRRALALWLAITGALAGCGLDLDPPALGPTNRCDATTTCTGSSRCDAELGMCVRDASEPYSYVLEITLPSDETRGRPALSSTAGPFIAGTGAASSEVIVRTPVPLAGRVVVDRVQDSRIEADIIFTPRAREFAPMPTRVTVTALGTAVGTRDDDFRTELMPGLTYDVEVRPRGADAERWPPLRTSFDLELPQRFDVFLPNPDTHFRLAGMVVDPSGAPRDGLEIRAVDEAGRLVSSVATSATAGDKEGRFEIFVDGAVERWFLQVSSSSTHPSDTPFPTILVDPSVLVWEGPEEDQVVRVLVPAPDQMGACFAGIVEFPEELGGGPVVGATVTLRARELYGAGGLTASYTIEVSTQAGTLEGGEPADRGCSPTALPAGGFAASVLPGVYDVEIRPIDASLGVLVEQREIVRDLLGHVLQLPPRPLLRGVVMRSSDEPVMDARVVALPLQTRLPGTSGSDASLLNRPNETLTDPVGNFQLPLDVGVYDLVAEPPVGSGFPWVVRPAFAMSARAWTEPLDVRDPVAIRGSARFDTGGACALAQVTAYAVVTDENGETRPVAIGRATTDAAGDFLLLLPPDVRTR